MGPGYKLYFIFIKYAGFLMFFMFIGVGIINCYINSIGQDCISEHELEKLLEKSTDILFYKITDTYIEE